MRRRGVLLAAPVLVAVAALSGCSVDQSDIDALETLPGVTSADSFCELGYCRVMIDVEPDVTAEALTVVLDEGLGVSRAENLEVTFAGSQSPRVELSFDTDTGVDTALLAGLAREAADTPGLVELRTNAGTRQVSWSEWTASDDESAVTDALESATARWNRITDLSNVTMTYRSGRIDGPADRLSLAATEQFPTGAVEAVTALDSGPARSALAAVRIDETGQLLLTSRSVDAAERLEQAAADRGIEATVVVAGSLLQLPDDAAERDADVRALLRAFDVNDDVAVIGRSIVVSDPSTPLRDVADAVDLARQAEPASARVVGFRIEERGEPLVELFGRGSADLVRLVAHLREQLTVRTIEVTAVDPGFRPRSGRAPEVQASVQIEVSADSLDEGVAAAARALSGWHGSETSLSLAVISIDPEGRSPRVSLRIDREGERWVASTIDRGVPSTVDAAIDTWRAASMAQR